MEKNSSLLDRVVDFSADGRRLIASVVAVSLILAGCSDFRERWFSSSDHTHLEGGRRAPALNPGGHGTDTGAAMAATPAPTAPTPYDTYHPSAPNSVASQADNTASVPMAKKDKGWFGGMFDGWFGDDSRDVASNGGRRRPMENSAPVANMHSLPTIESASSALAMDNNFPMENHAPVANMNSLPPMDTASAQSTSREAPKPLLEEDKGYPELSAVPATPARAEQFRKDKTASQNKFTDLETERKSADARRANLADEPGQLSDEASLSADEELTVAARKDVQEDAMPAQLPAPKKTPPTVEKEEGGLFSWVKNPFSGKDKKDSTMPPAARRPVDEGSMQMAAPVSPVETSRPVTIRAKNMTAMEVPPAPHISDERPLVLHAPASSAQYDEAVPSHVSLHPPVIATRAGRVLPQSRYAARRAQERERLARNSNAEQTSYY